MSNTLNKHIFQLLILGVCGILVSVLATSWLFSQLEYWHAYGTQFKILGIALGYFIVNYISTGGSVNYYLLPHKQTADEKTLDKLISKNRSKLTILLAAILYLVFNLGYGMGRYRNSEVNLDGIFLYFFAPFFLSLILCQSVKYVTVWINFHKKR